MGRTLRLALQHMQEIREGECLLADGVMHAPVRSALAFAVRVDCAYQAAFIPP
jgi:hypothetical protein